ncbi:MAG: tetratricopeptide repeat protein [Balneola sp.]|nr:MAG: tetratricopeptide repeat protein [Balneola sp.]
MNISFAYILIVLLLADPGNSDAKKGNDAYEKGDYAKAEELYRASIETDPENAEVYFNLANALAKQGKTEEAIQTYMEYRSMADSPEKKALAEYNIGSVLAQGQQWKPASQHFRNSLKLNPTDQEAKHNFERAMIESSKQNEQQQQEQQQNQDQEPPSEYAKAMKKRAEQLVGERKYQEALKIMQEALNADPTVQNFNDFIKRISDVSQIDS